MMTTARRPCTAFIADCSMRIGFAIVMAIGISCTSFRSSTEGNNRLGSSDAGSLPSQSIESSVARHLRIAEEAPGYGGFFRDPDTRQYFVYSSIEENDEAILAAWRGHVGINAAAIILRGKYDFRQLNAWYKEIVDKAWDLLTIHGFADEANQIFFGIRDEAALIQFWQIIDALGVPREAVLADVAPLVVSG